MIIITSTHLFHHQVRFINHSHSHNTYHSHIINLNIINNNHIMMQLANMKMMMMIMKKRKRKNKKINFKINLPLIILNFNNNNPHPNSLHYYEHLNLLKLIRILSPNNNFTINRCQITCRKKNRNRSRNFMLIWKIRIRPSKKYLKG